jgi:ribosomal-protein-alanine N-acetyltransferase
MATPQPIIRTERLILRPLVKGDAPEIQRLAGEREVADTVLRIPHPYPDGAADIWIEESAFAWETGKGVSYAITDAASGALLGAIGLSVTQEHAQAELGYWIGTAYWNRGLCTEAARAILELAFTSLSMHRVQARHFTRNAASGRVLRKLGMRLEGIQRDAVRKWDRFEDIAVHAILEDEWRSERGSAARWCCNRR